MKRGSIARRTSSGTNATAALEIIAPSGKQCIVREVHVGLAAATASTYGLGRPAAKGITPTSPVAMLPDRGGNSQVFSTTTALAWGTGPTAPAQFYRRVAFPATIATEILWIFKRGIYIPAGESLVLWNLATNGVVDVSVVIDE